MPATYEPIATTTLGSSVTSITFDISSTANQNYTDLVLVANMFVSGTEYLGLQFGTTGSSIDTGNNYAIGIFMANGAVYNARYTGQTNIPFNYSQLRSEGQLNLQAHIFNYSNSNVYKTAVCKLNGTAVNQGTELDIGLWNNTNPIKSVRLISSTQYFVAPSKFTLFGIKAA